MYIKVSRMDGPDYHVTCGLIIVAYTVGIRVYVLYIRVHAMYMYACVACAHLSDLYTHNVLYEYIMYAGWLATVHCTVCICCCLATVCTQD